MKLFSPGSGVKVVTVSTLACPGRLSYRSLQGFQQQGSVSSSPMTSVASVLAGSKPGIEATDREPSITPEVRGLWDTPAFAKGSIPETPPPAAVCF